LTPPRRAYPLRYAVERGSNQRKAILNDVSLVIRPHEFVCLLGPAEEGMGLAITRTLVERHGGRILAENTVGAGATFRFSLPAHAQPNAETPLPEREIVS
jgi:ABC-type nitrate/sulfonate/bicarbonate transport system ATPase subunit